MAVYRRNKGKGAWMVDIDEFMYPDGRVEPRIRKSSKKWNKRDAERVERRILDQLEAGTWGKRKEIPTVKEFEDEFIRNYAEARGNKPSEIKSKRTHFRLHLIPAFGKKRLNEFTVRDIDRFKRDKQEKYHPATINNILGTLRKMLNIAYEWEIINRVVKIEKMKEPQPTFKFLEYKEADQLLAAAEPEWFAMIMVALKCGLRPGEMHGLRWDDIDFDRRIIEVQRSIDRDGNIGTTKTNRSRVIPLCDDVFAALMNHRHKRAIWVFCDEQGAPLRDNKAKAPLKRAVKKAGLRPISWYTLRHTFASHLSDQGVPLATVQELMGHSTITMTMRYAHVVPGAKMDAVQKLNSGQSCGTIAAQLDSRMAK